MNTNSDLTTDPRITNEDLGKAIRELAHSHKYNRVFNLAAIYAANREACNKEPSSNESSSR